ncbi:MAG: rod shape-determining protein MreC [Marinilabiliaceae bacterium]|jgi:rod shape-determining protein MreC|nr:rod shape-determining protein MreC [Marinilabiliaceae bacterium]
MRSLLNFLTRYSNFILFILLEFAAIYMLTTSDGYHNIMISNKLKAAMGVIEKRISGASDYFSLREVNAALARENLRLRNRLENVFRDDEQYFTSVNDTVHRQQYVYTRAKAINQSTNRQKNFITLDKGSINGIETGMAVVGPDGIAGTVIGVSRNFSIAMSVLNLDFRLSARFRKNNYFGSLSWDGTNPGIVRLNEIPHHVNVELGDTVETSGYSSVFPAGLMIGRVADFNDEGGDFIRIDIELATDFNNLSYVYVIANVKREEQEKLEKGFINR